MSGSAGRSNNNVQSLINGSTLVDSLLSTAISARLASLFACSVCFEYVLPPTLQCQSGHLICRTCVPILNRCPTCVVPLGNIRNLFMEELSSTVMFPLLSSPVSLDSENFEPEEPYNCPCPGKSCKWQGGLEQVVEHVIMAHKCITILQGEDVLFLATNINLPGDVNWVMMQTCFGHHFMVKLEKLKKYRGHQQFFAIVQLIGSQKQCEKFTYRLELKGRHEKKITWEATPRSINEGVSTAIVNSDCLIFETNTAQMLLDSNGHLGINVTILRNV